MSTEMYQVAEAMNRYWKLGEIPSPGIGAALRSRIPFDPESVSGGRSANHELLGRLPQLAQPLGADRGDAIIYYATRAAHELTRALGATEGPVSPSYEGVSLPAWMQAWALMREYREIRTGRMIGRILELKCLVEALGWIPDEDAPGCPGQRADVGKRRVERWAVKRLLGLSGSFSSPDALWGPWLEGTRAINGLHEAIRPEIRAFRCLRAMRGEKAQILPYLRSLRLLIPLHVEIRGLDTLLWIARGTHGQDPPHAATLIRADGSAERLWNWQDGSNPPEGGWGMRCERSTFGLNARWTKDGISDIANHLDVPWRLPVDADVYDDLGRFDGPDSLTDLPPLPPPVGQPEGRGAEPDNPWPEPNFLPNHRDIRWHHVVLSPRRTLVLVRRVAQAAQTGQWTGVRRELAKWWKEAT